MATANIPGAYLNSYMPDFVLLRVCGETAEIMVKMNLERYERFVCIEKGKKVIYLRLCKALYGCIKSALLWYSLLSSTLIKMVFKINWYDKCVANKIVNGKECTILWYIDDLKISHVDSAVVDQMIQEIEKRFEKMTVSRGRDHKYMEMTISFPGNGTVSIKMTSYIEEATTAFEWVGCIIGRSTTTPAASELFEVKIESAQLDQCWKDSFHHMVAKLLYVSQQARVDIRTTIAFLCMRVSCPDMDDWQKLRRMLQYLSGTKHMKIILSANSINIIYTWVDTSYVVHLDMRSHTGGCVGVGEGKGVVHTQSVKQKLNTKSSTEAELVAASNYLPQSIWTHMFLEKQGYNIMEQVIYQDNESTMKLAKNGQQSSGPKTCHINIRFFFIKDRLQSERMMMIHCSTHGMLADFFTKPLQGSLFRCLKDIIKGHVKRPTTILQAVPQEHVGGEKNVTCAQEHNHPEQPKINGYKIADNAPTQP